MVANGVGVAGAAGQPDNAFLTAWMINATSTVAPLGTPCGHDDAGSLPSAIATSVTRELIVSVPVPAQSPTQGIAEPAIDRSVEKTISNASGRV